MDRAEARQRRREKIRNFVKPKVVWCLMFVVAAIKPFPFLYWLLPEKARELTKCWDYKMILHYILSGGSRVYMDQNCVLNPPATWKPLVDVDPKFRLTEEQIQSFYENGFIGPITLWTPEEMAEMRPQIEEILRTPSAIYPNASNQGRDRHLDTAKIWELIKSPQIRERLAQFLGPDLLVWRSQVFMKKPGDPETTWHQASTYMPERKYKAALEPKDINNLFQLTTWIAIDDADFENGCMHFLKGTHKKMWTIKLGGEGGLLGEMSEDAKLIAGTGKFANVQTQMTLEVPVKPETVVSMPLKAGQCVIFTERCMHGAPPNVSDRRRFGMVFRTVKTDVQVYRGDTEAAVAALKEIYNLENWGCVLLRGEDKYKWNKMLQSPAAKEQPELAASAS